MTHRNFNFPFRQRGASIVEFAFIALMFFTLLFGIVEFGRLFFNINSVQEITRRAAREQVVRWVLATDAVQREAVLRPSSTGTVYYPGAIDICIDCNGDVDDDKVQLSFYNTYANAVSQTSPINYSGSATPQTNLGNCLIGNTSCIRFVRATLSNANGSLVNFNVLAPFMPSNVFPLPDSTVIMPAEALGLL
jgi:hypothetical protein